jgi:prepilin-type N-terminal cleavage/methylation domain-containing protein
LKKRSACSILKNHNGFTLIEITAVMVIISVLAGVGVKKVDDISDSAIAKVLEHSVGELNSRELLTWALVKFSDQGWVSDEALFAQLDKNLAEGYKWGSGPITTGGTLLMKSGSITLVRTPSNISWAGRWAVH